MTNTRMPFLMTFAIAALAIGPASSGALAQSARETTSPTTSAVRSTPRSASTAPAPAVRPAANVPRPRRWNEQEYRLGPGDKLRVEVYKQDQLSQSLQVRPDGKITLPLVGDIAAAGRTSLELRDALTTSLKEYVNNPVVTVIVQEATSAQIYVVGEVVSPGPQILRGPLTALQALAQSGGLKEFADRGDIHVLRTTVAGREVIPFDYKQALKGKAEPFDLQPGDTIVVP